MKPGDAVQLRDDAVPFGGSHATVIDAADRAVLVQLTDGATTVVLTSELDGAR